jgi:hypothetical protein
MSDFWGRKKLAVPRWLVAGTATTQQEADRLAAEDSQSGVNIVEMPKHLAPPSQAQTVDFQRAAIIQAGFTVDLITFTPQLHGILGANVIFTHYGVFNDGLMAWNFAFQPLVNNQRVFPYHGNPMDINGNESQNFVIQMGQAPDLSDISLKLGMLVLQPTDTLIWRVTNNDVVDVAMGVRMKGYIDQGSRRIERRFGG